MMVMSRIQYSRFFFLLTITFATFMMETTISLPLWAADGGGRKYADPNKLTYQPLHFKAPKVERTTLKNGITLYLLEDHELPLVHFSVAIRTGSMYDPMGKEGLAELTSKVMRTGGAGKMNGSAIDDALEFVAASIEPSTSMEYTSWSMSIMKKDLDKGLDIFSQILRKPCFDDGKLKLARDLKLEELRRIIDDPQKMAFREFNRLLYRGNARGRLSSPTSIKRLTKEDLNRFHHEYYFPQNIMIAVTGNLSETEAVEKINAHFSNWDKQGQIAPVSPPLKQLSDQIYYLVKDIPQSIVITGQFAPAKKDRDFYAFEALDFMIGSGGFRSRIFQEVRTNRGLAYSTSSFYRARTDYGVFGAYAMTKTDTAPEVLSLIKAILQQARDKTPDAKELERTKRSMINSFIFEYQSPRQIVGQQMMLEYNKLPEDFLATYCAVIEQLTVRDLQRVGADHLRPDNMTVLILGTAEGYKKFKTIYNNIEEMRLDHD
jgi:zinc protease